MDNPFEMMMLRLDNIEQLLLAQKQQSSQNHFLSLTPSNQNEPSCTVDEIAEHLKCAKSTVLRYRRDGVFPSYKAGRTIYFKKSEVDAALSTIQKNVGRANNRTTIN
jgi:excisionase family DNA binding protein